jgi:3,4-dihydroxy 2-butanone 4-phosphate synthase/GTP cyclohydrolase II
LPDCIRFARRHGLKIISVEDLIQYRRQRERLVRAAGAFQMPTPHGEFRAHVYEDLIHGRKHMALVKGEVSSSRAVPVRVHSECLLGDAFGSLRCDCGSLLQQGMRAISREGGVFLYMRQVNPEEDFSRKLEGFAAEDRRARGRRAKSHHGTAMDARTYGIGAQILYDLGIRRLNLLTNHPKRIQGLEGYGLRIAKQTAL